MSGIWAVVVISLWLGDLSGWWPNQQLLTPSLWHAHEMLFGFGALVAAGFLLTAAQNWTGVPGVKGNKLVLLCAIWLAARLVPFLWLFLWAEQKQGLVLLIILQSLWWLGVIAALSRQLWLAKNPGNYPLAALLLAMAILNGSFLWLSQRQYALAAHLSHSMILMFCLLMGLIGGRVIPFFTARATQTGQIKTPGLDKLLLVTALLGTTLFIGSGFVQPLFSPGWLMLLAGIFHLVRLKRWFTPGLLRQPLLWSLHSSYLAMSIGLLLMGLSLLTGWVNFKDMLHLVAVGAMAGMMLAMMARVSLGHTGRPLAVGQWITTSFVLLLLAGLFRASALITGRPHLLWQLSAALWLISFLIFIRVYWPILTAPRLDGRAD
ncbi:heme transporter CcmB [Cellvibrio zantedeschiae]|uniref:Heme transporter CcmB n=2 Tax=Cellvibrio zantedeschiae TaxID=1237077 RepID=A0ABQ3B913_9GAMM|nr:heme transporter CcmB [Cellvibrio zantedeschiae]